MKIVAYRFFFAHHKMAHNIHIPGVLVCKATKMPDFGVLRGLISLGL
jgi:hypothetical protein